VRVTGVLLVFSYLATPALDGSFARQFSVGWGFGAAASAMGVAASPALDLPPGAAVARTFGVARPALAG
jgi:ABC-type Mn2+/Zn2+ transport system permease subunit